MFLNPETGKIQNLTDAKLSNLLHTPVEKEMKECTLTDQDLTECLNIIKDAKSYLFGIVQSINDADEKTLNLNFYQPFLKSTSKNYLLKSIQLQLIGHIRLFQDNLDFLYNTICYDLSLENTTFDRNKAYNQLIKEIASINNWFHTSNNFMQIIKKISEIDYIDTLQDIFNSLNQYIPEYPLQVLSRKFFSALSGKTYVDIMDNKNNEIIENIINKYNIDLQKIKEDYLKKIRIEKNPYKKAVLKELKERTEINLSENVLIKQAQILSTRQLAVLELIKPKTRFGRNQYNKDQKYLKKIEERALFEKNKKIKAAASASTALKEEIDHTIETPSRAVAITTMQEEIQGPEGAADQASQIPLPGKELDDSQEIQESKFQTDQVLPAPSAAAKLDDLSQPEELKTEEEDETDLFDPRAHHQLYQHEKTAKSPSLFKASLESKTQDYELLQMLNDSIFGNHPISWKTFERIILRNDYQIETTQKGSVRRVLDLKTHKKFTVHKPHNETDPMLKEYRSFIASGFEHVFELTREYVEDYLSTQSPIK
ncbi:MAG: hypothetical protein KBD31_05525 [Proteobacteria bacterium]|nr:hypothetical protein [Pseudomonadota bacterium]